MIRWYILVVVVGGEWRPKCAGCVYARGRQISTVRTARLAVSGKTLHFREREIIMDHYFTSRNLDVGEKILKLKVERVHFVFPAGPSDRQVLL
jgi:hypothetical protein